MRRSGRSLTRHVVLIVPWVGAGFKICWRVFCIEASVAEDREQVTHTLEGADVGRKIIPCVEILVGLTDRRSVSVCYNYIARLIEHKEGLEE